MSGQDHRKSSRESVRKQRPAVLDREHLSRYTMASAELEREIIGLFLMQLPSIVTLLKTAVDNAEWKFATHTLKGSALAIGADRIVATLRLLEATPVAGAEEAKVRLIARLDREIATFREAAGRL